MDFETKIIELKKYISETIEPLIDNDYILTDLPYHPNLGDILIWEGEKSFCNRLPYKCLGISNPVTFTFPTLPSNVIILLNGGGNFGDLWRSSQDFRLEVIKNYPHNRIIIFPQSIWYESSQLVINDDKIIANHNDLHICVRDYFSYKFLKTNFNCQNVYLVPDMAFYINDNNLIPFRKKNANHIHLFLKRTDKEYRYQEEKHSLIHNSQTHDWPSIERTPIYALFLIKLCGIIRRIPNKNFFRKFLSKFADSYADTIFRKRMLTSGYQFIAKYSSITTTRLHAMILGILLHKQIYYLDNSTFKISGYADTWLNDLDSLKCGNTFK